MSSNLSELSPDLRKKYDDLKSYLSSLGSVVVAFSGGVDSAFLLYAAKDALADKALAATAVAAFIPQREVEEAVSYCKELGVAHIFAKINIEDIPHFTENPSDRCYHCKHFIFSTMLKVAKDEEKNYIVEGSNVDDTGDYRPGMKALKELEIKSPLKEAGLSKAEIRELSKFFDLPTWDKPSFACLASRVPYGSTINSKKLSMVENAENFLLEQGFKQFRVRVHDGEKIARIELLPEDFGRMMDTDLREKTYSAFKGYGFAYTALDLIGYRTGSLNETLDLKQSE